MYLIQWKEVGNLKANANPSNPVGRRVHFVSTFCKSRDRSCDHRKLPSCFGRTKITQCTTRMEDYFLKPRWKWNNGYSIVPVFLYNRLKKIISITSHEFATTTDGEVPPSFNLTRFDLNKDCCLKLFTNKECDYFSHSICSFYQLYFNWNNYSIKFVN